MVYYSCKGDRTMTFQEYVIKTDCAKTAFKCGVTASLSVEIATPEQKVKWIAEELAKLEADLEAIDKAFDEQDKVGDPFAEGVKN
jgi:hypothetical protein